MTPRGKKSATRKSGGSKKAPPRAPFSDKVREKAKAIKEADTPPIESAEPTPQAETPGPQAVTESPPTEEREQTPQEAPVQQPEPQPIDVSKLDDFSDQLALPHQYDNRKKAFLNTTFATPKSLNVYRATPISPEWTRDPLLNYYFGGPFEFWLGTMTQAKAKLREGRYRMISTVDEHPLLKASIPAVIFNGRVSGRPAIVLDSKDGREPRIFLYCLTEHRIEFDKLQDRLSGRNTNAGEEIETPDGNVKPSVDPDMNLTMDHLIQRTARGVHMQDGQTILPEGSVGDVRTDDEEIESDMQTMMGGPQGQD